MITSSFDSDYDVRLGSGTSTETGYFVEAKWLGNDPVNFRGQILDNKWRRQFFSNSPVGIPQCKRHQRLLQEHNFCSYEAAQALRWWLHAEAGKERFLSFGLTTRLVQVKIEQTYSMTAIQAVDVVDLKNQK